MLTLIARPIHIHGSSFEESERNLSNVAIGGRSSLTINDMSQSIRNHTKYQRVKRAEKLIDIQIYDCTII